MITENLSTLKIHKLTQEQYDRELAAGNIDETALYLTPEKEIDLIQSDWNQNDESQLDYIKNRPFYENGETVVQLDEKFIPDSIARTEDIPSTAIKPFPYYEVNKLNDNWTRYKVNIEELEDGILYSMQESASTPYTMFSLCVICDDGTEKIPTNVAVKYDVYHIIKNTNKNKIQLYNSFGNTSWNIDISDKSTADNVIVKYNFIRQWLPLSNTREYTPRDDYNPATKKYVDDTATTAANAIKNDLLNGAGEAYDTLKELGDLIDDNVDAIEALEIIATGKANVSDIPTKVSQLANDSGYITEAPQSDWSQTDETATNYIKNKPILATSEEIKALFN